MTAGTSEQTNTEKPIYGSEEISELYSKLAKTKLLREFPSLQREFSVYVDDQAGCLVLDFDNEGLYNYLGNARAKLFVTESKLEIVLGQDPSWNLAFNEAELKVRLWRSITDYDQSFHDFLKYVKKQMDELESWTVYLEREGFEEKDFEIPDPEFMYVDLSRHIKGEEEFVRILGHYFRGPYFQEDKKQTQEA